MRFGYNEATMKLHQLAALVSAAESGSLRQAAAKMRLSQPALSRSIRELETETGVKLLERTALGVKATVYGEALILRSRIVDAELRHAREDIAYLKAATHGDLRIGATPVAAFSLLPIMLARFKKTRPQLRVTISDRVGESLLAGLRQGDFDIVFCRIFDSIDAKEFAVDVLFDDSLVVIARRGHPLGQVRDTSKIDWQEYDWVLPGDDSPVRTAFQRTFYERVGKPPKCTIEANNFVTTLTLLSQTNYLGVAPRQIFRVSWLLQEFTSLNLGFKFPAQPTGVMWRARSPLSSAAQFAIKELRRAAQQAKRGRT
jgi:DNA-binding transcriptional LysR family regulator